ncbi:hypothetical protein ABE61_05275 [Lysinibacillus sphaericus]|uniref:hypothetical protein n=1 Tax=Lysinibacillus sphaericus TaxID=1421 RepID=UPI001DD9B195|nr:hypothetical protein [Lysinibacillus sphaericus]MBG9453506.1 hypothetical protein [Lysinibacillus sphaericus]MBG9480351.1 hypothetical protein [Lysinibacillus sphaericus]MBG9595030.1 hypothetical protein [Lysinibacillus sphaericus]
MRDLENRIGKKQVWIKENVLYPQIEGQVLETAQEAINSLKTFAYLYQEIRVLHLGKLQLILLEHIKHVCCRNRKLRHQRKIKLQTVK